MKALTLPQPWASLIALGAKSVETRVWPTSYRGPLAIHAGKSYPKEARAFAVEHPAWDALRPLWLDGSYQVGDLPTGAVVATAELIAVLPVLRFGAEARKAHLEISPRGELQYWPLSEETRRLMQRCPLGTWETAFAEFTPGRWAWILADVQRLPRPVPALGAQGLWEWERAA